MRLTPATCRRQTATAYPAQEAGLISQTKIMAIKNISAGERVKAMERAFNRAVEVIHSPRPDIHALRKTKDTVDGLKEYQTSGLWLKDFESEEAGELPEGISSGVLSEDGLYNLLIDYDRIIRELEE